VCYCVLSGCGGYWYAKTQVINEDIKTEIKYDIYRVGEGWVKRECIWCC